MLDVFLSWLDVSTDPFWNECWMSSSNMDAGLVPPMVRCECWAFLAWMQDVFLLWLDVSVGWAFLTWMKDVFLPWSDISTEEEEDQHGG